MQNLLLHKLLLSLVLLSLFSTVECQINWVSYQGIVHKEHWPVNTTSNNKGQHG